MSNILNKSLMIILILFMGMLLPTKISFADPNQKIQEIDIATSPHKIFYNLSNLKPGDYALKTLTVSNKGSQDFNYLFSNKFLDGSEKFYDELLLVVERNDNVLFNGKLKDFKKLEPRPLESGKSEELTICIEMPYELGNEFQGLGSEFQFKFYVEGTLGGAIPVDNKLPDTATNLFNYLLIGATLILGGSSMYLYQRRKKLNMKKEN